MYSLTNVLSAQSSETTHANNAISHVAKAVSLFGILTISSLSQAAIITTDNTVQVDLPGISTFQVNGAAMDGTRVTAVFLSGATNTQFFADTGPSSGAASGNNGGDMWSLSVDADTFTNDAWTWSQTGVDWLVELIIDGAPGLTVFDIDGAAVGTPGSANGRPFVSSLTNDALVGVEYSRQVGINLAAPVGDLYEVMHVSFESANGLLTTRGFEEFTFSADTDNDIRAEVPEPATLGLLGLGMLLVGSRAKRNAAKA